VTRPPHPQFLPTSLDRWPDTVDIVVPNAVVSDPRRFVRVNALRARNTLITVDTSGVRVRT
jgi:hypothetical protein